MATKIRRCSKCGKEMFIGGGFATCFDCFYKVKLEPTLPTKTKATMFQEITGLEIAEFLIQQLLTKPLWKLWKKK